MKTAKIFTHGHSQAVRLPKEFRFKVDEVYIEKSGEDIILMPKKPDPGSHDVGIELRCREE